MGFLDRIGKVLENKINFFNPNKKVEKNYLDSSNKTLSRTVLKDDIFQNSKEVEKIALLPSDHKNNTVTKPELLTKNETARLFSFVQKYANYETLNNALEVNPNIKRILKENNLECKINMDNINSIIKTHLIPCAQTAKMMYQRLGHNEDEESFKALVQASLLHDIGKAFIPCEILNKKGKLTKAEREIVELHNKLSYEILITTDLSPKVAQLALEHHNYENNIKRSPENQLLTIADCYCALREDRPYKKAMSDICAKTILYDMGTKGSFDTRFINYINA